MVGTIAMAENTGRPCSLLVIIVGAGYHGRGIDHDHGRKHGHAMFFAGRLVFSVLKFEMWHARAKGHRQAMLMHLHHELHCIIQAHDG